MKFLLLQLIRLYQKTLSPDHGWFRAPYGHCRYQPTCSEYAAQAIDRYGALRGSLYALRRILRCHPFAQPRVDPLP